MTGWTINKEYFFKNFKIKQEYVINMLKDAWIYFSKKNRSDISVIICVLLYNKRYIVKPFLFYCAAASLIALDYTSEYLDYYVSDAEFKL